jgi:hypothetical protein
VKCIRSHLDAPGLTSLNEEQILFWFRNVTLEDLQIVLRQIEADEARRQ